MSLKLRGKKRRNIIKTIKILSQHFESSSDFLQRKIDLLLANDLLANNRFKPTFLK